MNTDKPCKLINLRTEYETDPIGLGTAEPRFSWMLQTSTGGMHQTSYHLIVYGSKEKDTLSDVMWDSGQVNSDESIQVEYTGLPLQSDTTYYWRVRIWDQDGKAAEWSETASFRIGLLHEKDLLANWITLADEVQQPLDKPASDGERLSSDLSEVHWIVLPSYLRQGDAEDVYAGEMTYFRKVIELPADASIERAWLCGTGDCRPIAFLNRERVATSYHYRYPSWVEITESLRPGRNELTYMLNNSAGYDTGVNYAALAASLTVVLSDGTIMRWLTDDGWQCAAASEVNWSEGPSGEEPWVSAVMAARFGEGLWTGPFEFPPLPIHPARNDVFYARTTWTLPSTVRRAVLYATALGVYRAFVNGKQVGEHVLAPGWTDYKKRVMVQAYDVTDLVQLGDNAMGLSVAPGWYSGCVGMFGPYQYGTKPHAWAQLHIECEDGSHHQIVSDASWRASRGPVRYADMLMGEIFDAREEIPGWAEAGQPQSGNWQQVQAQELSAFSGKLAPHIGPPVRVVMELPIQSIKELSPGVYIVDFGQNVVGWARMQVEGERGTCVRLRFAEMLNEDGSVYVTNLRSARATDVYVLKGEGTEVFEPSATFHGFRYMEVTGYPRIPTEADFTACVVASDTPVAAKLETSDALLNQLYSNIVWGQRDNFLSVPTDCPQRDERLGWTGDAQIFARTAAYNMDVASFFTKWMRDVGDAQRESGAVTNVVPHLGWLQDGIAAWADAVVIVPWTIWKMYGDKRILVESYSSMCKHMEYMRQTAPAWLRPAAGFGDWLSIEAETPKDLLATAYFGYCAKLMLEIADVIGEAEDAERYRDWLSQIRLAFNEAYVSKDGALLGETQTAYVLALHMDLLPEELRASAAKRLVADIQTKGNHLSTGFIGVSYLLPVLCESGYPEVAYSLLEQRTFPSWLYSVLEGATTIWERWNGWTKEHGFYSAVMNSFNHYSLGSVGEWMFRYMAGIELDPAKPGFKKMILRPWIGGSLTYVNAEYESMYGAIKSGWSLEESSVVYSVSIPANTEATLILPVGRAKPGSEEEVYIWSDVTRYQAALEQKGLILLSSTDQETQFHALPGSYKFVWNK